MPKNFSSKKLYRVIDANINRAKEGLRVCEEITRFILNNRVLTSELKTIRHNLEGVIGRLPINRLSLINERDSCGDIGKNVLAKEMHRGSCRDILLANLSRTKESVRVLEEFSKLINKGIARDLKEIRYLLYNTEKKIVVKTRGLRNLK